jgi:hypothetical protein
MADLINYCKTIQHAISQNGNVESAACKAILFDIHDNGFVFSLDNKDYNQVCQVDYINTIENGIILIELKDLSEQLELKTVEDILENLGKKYTKSIEIIQKHISQHLIPTLYYVVVKNDTDIVVLDNFFPVKKIKIKFKGVKYFVICKTNEICKKLSTLNTRLCQE